MAQGSGTSSSCRRGPEVGSLSSAPEWEGRETLRLRELEEARARAAQMEKTMKWWSDCTANWRDKWSKVRNERNRSREEAKQLRCKLDGALKDVSTYKRDKQELEGVNERMRKELERIHLVLLKHAGTWDNRLLEALELPSADSALPGEDCSELNTADTADPSDLDPSEHTLDPTDKDSNSLATPEQVKVWPGTECSADCGSVEVGEDCGLTPQDSHHGDEGDDKISILRNKLEQANKSLHLEREERALLSVSVERLQTEAISLRERCEELRASRQDAVRELLSLQDQHANTVALIRADLMDETNSREGMDRRLADLRAQVERLQGENAAEWGKREKVEAEKQAVERESKRLRADLLEMQERLDKKTRLLSPTDTSHLHHQISDKTREVLELKHSERKLRKMVGDKTSECAHMSRRCEQLEAEVRRLRTRVEDLRRDLAVAEDEIDSATDNIRKMQRANDELQEQMEALHLQMESQLNSVDTPTASVTSVPPVHLDNGDLNNDPPTEEIT